MIDRPSPKYNLVRFTPQIIFSSKIFNEKFYIETPGENSVISPADIYLEMETDVKCQKISGKL